MKSSSSLARENEIQNLVIEKKSWGEGYDSKECPQETSGFWQ